MILQVFADAWQVVHDRYSHLAQKFTTSDSGELQQLGTLDRACGENDFLRRVGLTHNAVTAVLDPPGSTTFADDLARVRLGFDAQVRAPRCRTQVSHRAAATPAPPREQLV